MIRLRGMPIYHFDRPALRIGQTSNRTARTSLNVACFTVLCTSNSTLNARGGQLGVAGLSRGAPAREKQQHG